MLYREAEHITRQAGVGARGDGRWEPAGEQHRQDEFALCQGVGPHRDMPDQQWCDIAVSGERVKHVLRERDTGFLPGQLGTRVEIEVPQHVVDHHGH